MASIPVENPTLVGADVLSTGSIDLVKDRKSSPNSLFGKLYSKLSEIRQSQQLSCPGSFENLHLQAKMMQPTNHLIEGAKFEFTSIVSPNFQVLHSLTWGKSQEPPAYNLGAFYSEGKLMMHGNVDDKGSLTSRLHYSWTPPPVPQQPPHDPTKAPHEQPPPVPPEVNRIGTTSKVQLSLQGQQNMIQVEHDIVGPDWSAVLRAVNPNPVDSPITWKHSTQPSFTGIFQAGYLKSISKSIAIGAELTYERPLPDVESSSITYAFKWSPPSQPLAAPSSLPPGFPSPFPPVNPKDSTEVLTATYTPSNGLVHASYWRKINQRLEVGTEAQLLVEKANPENPGGFGRREGIANIGFKLDTVNATIRAMVDTSGKLSTFIDERIIPGIAFQLSGTLDYLKGYEGKVGVGFTLEA